MIHFNTSYPASPPNGDAEIVPRKLFVGGLSYDTTDSSLATYFSQFGQISSATVLRDPVNSHSRGFGFVTFADDFGASRVLAQSRNHIVDGRKVEAKLAFPKTKKTRQLPTSSGSEHIGYNGGFNQSLQPLGLGMSSDGFNMPMNIPYEQQPVYHNNLSELYSTNLTQTGVDSNNQEYDTKGSYSSMHFPKNSLSASLGSQSFQQEPFSSSSRSPRASVVETTNFPRHTNNLRRKTLSHIHLQSDLSNDITNSTEERIPSKLYVPTNDFESLDLNVDSNQCTILITGIAEDTLADDLNKFCTTFGKVSSATMDPQGFGKVVFEDGNSVDKVMSYQRINGNLFFEGKEIIVTRDTTINKSSGKRWVERPYVRANTFQSDRELFGDDDSDREAPISLMRAMSVTQNMLNRTSANVEYTDFSNRHNILRDDKNRSLSVIASLNKDNTFLEQNLNFPNRRSSSFAERALDLDYENESTGQL